MTTTNLSLSVTIEDSEPNAVSDVFADLTLMAKGYIRSSHGGVSVSVYNASEPDPEPTDEDLGRIAYDAHAETLLAAELTDAESVDDFDDLHPDHRRAWVQAALAARNA